MGCDIHLFVEKKINGKWLAVKGVNEPEIKEAEEFIENIKARGESADYWEKRIEELRQGTQGYIWDGRHYLLFEALAGVRANHEITPISEPKGLPEDISAEVKDSAEGWGGDGHSHSYLTAAELNAYKWDQTIAREGFVNVHQFKEFQEKGSPSGWCGSVGGGGVRHVTNHKMKKQIEDDFPFGDSSSYYTLVRWEKSLREALGSFCSWSLPELNKLVEGNPENVRIVFWFDN
ncbi:hypothetical protein [Paenibacillus donghaensis]|uniref:Uncharacterized protein n=1 Tax=Paenibacillus donghaensis TaxID=414771 RepID=A0A2Z2KGK3_9BACL|nr:hypothetical protein [Paenibacillus donghaensis]ASA22343.1 hypothetical protein B9T62_17060 [Paenibacillus donghaensis]